MMTFKDLLAGQRFTVKGEYPHIYLKIPRSVTCVQNLSFNAVCVKPLAVMLFLFDDDKEVERSDT